MKVPNITIYGFVTDIKNTSLVQRLVNAFVILNCCGKLYFGIILVLDISLFRLHNHNPPTYETGSTRKFLLGRTDTIRSASIASSEFVKAMVSPNKTVSIKLLHWITLSHTEGARTYPSFCGMKHLVVSSWTSFGKDARSLQGSSGPPSSKLAGTHSWVRSRGASWNAWSLRSLLLLRALVLVKKSDAPLFMSSNCL